MENSERRKFIQLMGLGAVAGALPGSISRALAIPANNRTGTIADVEHIVILTQENRSFDQYFGTMKGVRGFSDPRAVKLSSGNSVFYQPNGTGYVLPFRPDVPNMGMQFMEDVSHGWNGAHAAWNAGNYDQWVPNKGTTSMVYMNRHDIPYHYALADAFTVCDAYYCSLMGPTDPNRYHLWSGWTGNDGNGGGPVISNAEAGYDWTTYPERLQNAGISWKIYQDVGTGLDENGYWGWTDNPYIGNYGDNSLLYFHQYQNAQPGTPLADYAKTGTNISAKGSLVDIFREDVRSGNLPQVSWITAPEALSEHPNWPVNYGAWFISQFLDALTDNPEVWSKTVFIVNYDENGGFFDHMVSPTPPQSGAEGMSTVSTSNEIFTGDSSFVSGPYGLGVRVPMLVISPWSKGGYVNSQVFDHTSIIRFIEARFAGNNPDLIEQNITPWRRAVAGDLTSAFNFANPNDKVVLLPATGLYQPQDALRHDNYVPVPPVDQRLPAQEHGVRRARALPYALHAHGHMNISNGSFNIDFGNVGQAAAVFQVRSGNVADLPRTYTVEPGKVLSDAWNVIANGVSTYDLSVYGPNGFMRTFKGDYGSAHLDIRISYDKRSGGLTLTIVNQDLINRKVRVFNNYTGKSFVEHLLEPKDRMSRAWPSNHNFGWYDITIKVIGDADFEYHLAGHVETGRDSMSDPAIGGLALKEE